MGKTEFDEIKKIHSFKKGLHGALTFYRKRNEEFLEKEGMFEVLEFLLTNEQKYKFTFEIQTKEKQQALVECAKILLNVMISLSKEKLDKKFIVEEFKKCTPLSFIVNNEPTNKPGLQ